MRAQQISSKSLWTRIVLIAAVVATIASLCLAAETSDAKLRADLMDMEPCVTNSVFSFHYDNVYPPTTTEALKELCKRQLEGLKCIKNKSKHMPSIIKRGLDSFVQARKRHHKKYCTNVNSELAQGFLRDMSCIMEKKFPKFRETDMMFSNKLVEIYRRNFNDSGTELKHLCCAMVIYRKSFISDAGPECTRSAASLEEMIWSTISQELSLICDDEEKLLTKTCPSLPQMNLSKKFNNKPGLSPSVLALYLVATLGEPQETAPAV